MANKKLTITISDDALSKLEVQAKALDLTPNSYVKIIAMNHVNNTKFTWFTQEQRQAILEFSSKQSQLINTLNKLDEEYLKQGASFPKEKLLDYFKSYHQHFQQCIERISNGDI